MSNFPCQEIFLEDVVSVVVFKSAGCNFAIPPTISAREISLPTLPTPILKTHISDKDGFVTMSDRPTLKITNSRSAAGDVYTHELQIPTVLGRYDAEEAVKQLQGYDFFIVYQKTDGSGEISYPLPNTSVADIEESVSPTLSATIKLKSQSMSPLIRVV